jgi:hypothetical protein
MRHEEWETARQTPDDDRLKSRARHLALSLFELGEGPEDTERQLMRWNYPPLLARDAMQWAAGKHAAAGAVSDDHAAWRPNVTETRHFVTSNGVTVGTT